MLTAIHIDEHSLMNTKLQTAKQGCTLKPVKAR